MLNELMDALIDALKEEAVYKDYLQSEEDLKAYAPLLASYKEAKEEYAKMKPYFKYQDFSSLKERVVLLANEVTKLDAYQKYHQCQQALENRLQEICDLIFANILEEEAVDVCE